MAKILTQNGKMRKSSTDSRTVFNFGIPAFRSANGMPTCPNAKACASGCYAKSGTYLFSQVKKAYENRLELTQDPAFALIMVHEVTGLMLDLKRKGKQLFVRIHDSGDFYSEEYLDKWLKVIRLCPSVQFYAYTKMVSLLKSKQLPNNLTIIYSFGGTEDHLIDCQKDRHAKVFNSPDDLVANGYANGTDDDFIAAIGQFNKIGLVYHGVKKFDNTLWGKV